MPAAETLPPPAHERGDESVPLNASRTGPDRRPAVIIGHPGSVFPQRLAGDWRRRGMDVAIVTRTWQGPAVVGDGIRVLASAPAESPGLRMELDRLERRLRKFERVVLTLERSRYRRAMGAEEHQDHQPSFVLPMLDALSIAPFVDSLAPAFVFGQEAFSYGLATAACACRPKVIMPWGGDILRFAETTSVAFEMVRWALNNVDLVLPDGAVAARHVPERFGVPAARVHSASWGVDPQAFQRASPEARMEFCRRHAIDPSWHIVLNGRRFKPNWGSDVALEAFLRLARENPRVRCFMLGGLGSESFIAEARRHLDASGLADRIKILDGHVPDAVVRELFSVADVFTSFVRYRDTRSHSILEGAAAGSVPILSKMDEYLEITNLGFRALFVDLEDPDSIVAALRRGLQDVALRQEIVAANRQYILTHDDFGKNMARMLEWISAAAAGGHPSAALEQASAREAVHRILASCRPPRLASAAVAARFFLGRVVRRLRRLGSA